MDRKKIFNFVLLSAILLTLGFSVTQTIGLGAGGFSSSDILGKFNFYSVGGIYMTILILLFISQIIITTKDKIYGDSISYSNLGEFPSINFFKRFSQFQLFYLSVLFFGIFGIFVFTYKQTYTSTLFLEQQFTPTASLLFSSLLIPISENLGLAVVISMILVLLGIYARKINMNKVTFGILSFILILTLSGLYGLANHLLRYQGVDMALLTVFLFWAIGGILSLATGSFIPFWILHIVNNLFYDMRRLFDADDVIIGSIIVLIILIIGYGFLYKGRLFGRKKLYE